MHPCGPMSHPHRRGHHLGRRHGPKPGSGHGCRLRHGHGHGLKHGFHGKFHGCGPRLPQPDAVHCQHHMMHGPGPRHGCIAKGHRHRHGHGQFLQQLLSRGEAWSPDCTRDGIHRGHRGFQAYHNIPHQEAREMPSGSGRPDNGTDESDQEMREHHGHGRRHRGPGRPHHGFGRAHGGPSRHHFHGERIDFHRCQETTDNDADVDSHPQPRPDISLRRGMRHRGLFHLLEAFLKSYPCCEHHNEPTRATSAPPDVSEQAEKATTSGQNNVTEQPTETQDTSKATSPAEKE